MAEFCYRLAKIGLAFTVLAFVVSVLLPDYDDIAPNTFMHRVKEQSYVVLLLGILLTYLFAVLGFFGSLSKKKSMFFVCSGFLAAFLGFPLLVGLTLPMISISREPARQMQNQNQLHQLAIAMQNYCDEYKRFPPHRKEGHSWRVYLLPYLEEKDLFDKIRLDEPWNSDWNRQFHDKMPRCFANPVCQDLWNTETTVHEDGSKTQRYVLSETTYCLIVGGESAYLENGDGPTRNDPKILGKEARTILIAESAPGCWMDPTFDIPYEEALKGVSCKAKNQNVSMHGIWYHGTLKYTGFQAAFYDGRAATFLPARQNPPDWLRYWLVGEKTESDPRVKSTY